LSRTADDIGILTSTYATAVTIKASIQAVNRSVYEANGLDFNKKYVTIFSQTSFTDIDRDISSDKVTYGGETYQLLNRADWQGYDGWNYIMGVRID
jgi:hypothetical protein